MSAAALTITIDDLGEMVRVMSDSTSTIVTRPFPAQPELFDISEALLAAQLGRGEALQLQLGQIIPHLFPHLGGRHRGEEIRDVRSSTATTS
jgi:hypothetical protein